MMLNNNELSNTEIIERLIAIESRLSRLEEGVGIDSPLENIVAKTEYDEQVERISDDESIESRVGESGLAWLGNIVLFFGISFLVQYIQFSGYQLTSSIFGYGSVAGIFTLSHFLKKSYPKMASIFILNAWLLLFYITLSLHFFSEAPIISSKAIGLFLLVIVVLIQLFISYRKRSISLASIALVLSGIVAIISDSTHFMLPMCVFIAVVGVVFLYRFGWIRILQLSIFLVYLSILIWFFNDPFMGHPLQAISDHNFGVYYLFAIAAIFSLVALIRKSELFSKTSIVSSITFNGVGFSMALALLILTFFKEDYVLLIGAVSTFCLIYSVILQIKSEWKITAALYALFGFVTLSIAFHGIYGFPRAYFFLAVQSLLVVSMAIWFRSKFIVVMNALLFLTLLIFYMRTSTFINGVNISFTLVAFLTARILNWKKDRLTIKTEMLRNFYLISGFFMTLITLYHMVPDKYITLSWTLAAVIYFVLSFVLKKVKYRYLALGTMIFAAFYFFIIDLARIELVFRIIALMFLALISIGLSIYYSKKTKRKTEKNET